MAETVSDIAGGDNDYATLILWETDKDGDITAGNAEVAEVYADLSVGDYICNFLGWTTDADSYIGVRAAASVQRSSANPLRAGQAITLTVTAIYRSVFLINAGAEFTRIDGFDLIVNAASSVRPCIDINLGASTTVADVRISNCVCTFPDGVAATGGIHAIETDDNTAHIINIWNCVFYITYRHYYSDNSGSDRIVNIYNCVGYGGTNAGFYPRYGGTNYAWNTISYNNAGASTDFLDFDGGDYNMSEDATAPGANSLDSGTGGNDPDFVNVGAGTEDFHLQATSDAIDTGHGDADGGGEPSATFTDDIDYVTRPVTDADWDMGASEFVAGVGVSPTGVFYGPLAGPLGGPL